MTSRPATPTALGSVQVGPETFVPPPVARVEDTGLQLIYLADLALKILYSSGYLTGFRIAELMALPFTGQASSTTPDARACCAKMWAVPTIRLSDHATIAPCPPSETIVGPP